jgi:hypothetical protein
MAKRLGGCHGSAGCVVGVAAPSGCRAGELSVTDSSRQGFELLAYADECFELYRMTSDTDHWCRARKAERAGLAWLAQANGSLGLFAELWVP